MNDKAVWSQSASYAGMWHSNPPSLLPQREVSKLQKIKGKKRGGGGACKFLTTNPVLASRFPPRFPAPGWGKGTWEGKSGVPPEPPATPLDREGRERSRLWGSSMRWVGVAVRAPWGLTPARVGRFWISCLG